MLEAGATRSIYGSASDFVFEPIAFLSGNRNDLYAIQQIVGPFAIWSFILIAIGLGIYSISSTLSHLLAFKNTRFGDFPMKQDSVSFKKETT